MVLNGDRLVLRYFEETDAEALLTLRKNNKDFFQKFDPTYDADYCTMDNVKKSISKWIKGKEKDKMYYFGVFRKDTGQLVGDISLFQVRRGPLERSYLGYSIDRDNNDKGYATEAVKLIVKFGFENLNLHRIEAGANPENIASMRVLEKSGFHKEGIERKGIKINGKWQDHQVFSMLEDEL
jgi:[ribosomal protein S5]-alanine N-acetyltransferase